MPLRFLSIAFLLLCSLIPAVAQAELKLSSIFGDHMVLQREQPIHVWGWAEPGAEVKITLGDDSVAQTAGNDGRFDAKLASLPAGGPHTMSVKAGSESVEFSDVLIGEVWVCSGQSNMQWNVGSSDNADLEILTAKYPNLRLVSVPQVGTQDPQNDFNGEWKACTPETVKGFSAVGYFFGRQIHETLDIPVGLINNAWGGSAAEAWVPRDVLESDACYAELLAKWDETAKAYDHDAVMAKWKAKVAKWEETKKGNRPRSPKDPLAGQHRPANLYNGVLLPTIGYTIRGTIWYQGETNAGRAHQYRHLFPLMIKTWREKWGQGDFPFYWVQLADFRDEVETPGDSTWAELREAQTMALSLPNSGEAVILNLGEANDIHPKNKQRVAKNLARWALAKDYGITIPCRSPSFKSMEIKGNRIDVDFTDVGGRIDTFDVRRPIGFTVAGEDKKFVRAEAKIVDKDTIQVWTESVKNPVAVRYAWADNPVCNVQSSEGLPATPFRTDQWTGITEGVTK